MVVAQELSCFVDLVDPRIERYADEHSSPEPEHLRALAAETREKMAASGMMVGHLEGGFLQMLVAGTGARRVLEIGMFTGYSALSMAAGLPPGGHIITCDVDPEAEAIARRHIEASPYADRIEIRMGPALDTVRAMPGGEPFDFAFIDADKVGYLDYYEETLRLLRPGGLAMTNARRCVFSMSSAARSDVETAARAAANVCDEIGLSSE